MNVGVRAHVCKHKHIFCTDALVRATLKIRMHMHVCLCPCTHMRGAYWPIVSRSPPNPSSQHALQLLRILCTSQAPSGCLRHPQPGGSPCSCPIELQWRSACTRAALPTCSHVAACLACSSLAAYRLPWPCSLAPPLPPSDTPAPPRCSPGVPACPLLCAKTRLQRPLTCLLPPFSLASCPPPAAGHQAG